MFKLMRSCRSLTSRMKASSLTGCTVVSCPAPYSIRMYLTPSRPGLTTLMRIISLTGTDRLREKRPRLIISRPSDVST